MGACASIDSIDVPPNDDPPMTVAERQRSLVEFVRTLSKPSGMTVENTKEVITRAEDLTQAQEAFLSGYKMEVYGFSSDSMQRVSTFDAIEEEFYNIYHKKLLRKVLYEIFKLY